MRIMLLCPPHYAATGYGVQAASLLPRLAALPEVGSRANVGVAAIALPGAPGPVEGFSYYPLGYKAPDDPVSIEAVAAAVRRFAPAALLSLYDAWKLPHLAAAIAPVLWLPWAPIDCDPVSPLDVAALQGCHMALAMSRFGLAQLQQAGVPSTYIPHGVEESTYRVHGDLAAVRAFRDGLAGRPVHHLSVIVAGNGMRKYYEGQMTAWAAFAADKPAGTLLYCHAPQPWPDSAPDLYALSKKLGIADKVLFPPNISQGLGVSSDIMTMLYNSADVLLGATAAEGFGIPVIEAQACGVPVIVSDNSAPPELVRWGRVVSIARRAWVPVLSSYWSLPSVEGITAALQELYDAEQAHGGSWPLKQRQAVSARIHAEYGWDHVFKTAWAPLLRQLSKGG